MTTRQSTGKKDIPTQTHGKAAELKKRLTDLRRKKAEPKRAADLLTPQENMAESAAHQKFDEGRTGFQERTLDSFPPQDIKDESEDAPEEQIEPADPLRPSPIPLWASPSDETAETKKDAEGSDSRKIDEMSLEELSSLKNTEESGAGKDATHSGGSGLNRTPQDLKNLSCPDNEKVKEIAEDVAGVVTAPSRHALNDAFGKISQFEKRLAGMEGALEGLQWVRSENDDLRTQNQELHEQNDELQKQNKALGDANAQLRGQIGLLQDEANELNVQLIEAVNAAATTEDDQQALLTEEEAGELTGGDMTPLARAVGLIRILMEEVRNHAAVLEGHEDDLHTIGYPESVRAGLDAQHFEEAISMLLDTSFDANTLMATVIPEENEPGDRRALLERVINEADAIVNNSPGNETTALYVGLNQLRDHHMSVGSNGQMKTVPELAEFVKVRAEEAIKHTSMPDNAEVGE